MSELASSKVGTAELSAALDSATSQGANEARQAEGALRALQYELHVQGRESQDAVRLCRHAVKELAALHASLDVCLGGMEDTAASGAAGGAPAVEMPAPAGAGGGGAPPVVAP